MALESLIQLIQTQAATDGMHDTLIRGVQLGRFSAPLLAERCLRRPSLAVAAQGAKRIKIGSETFSYNAGSYIVGALYLPMEVCVTSATKKAPYLGVVMELDLTQLLSMGVGSHTGPIEQTFRGAFTDKAGPEMLDAVTRLVRIFTTPQHIPVMAPMIQREILYHILCSRHGAQLRQLAQIDSRVQRIAHAVDWLRQNFHRPFSMQELSKAVGMSVSGLHHRFRSIVMMTPLQYHKGLRLEEARRLMVSTGIDASTASYKVGYASPSQFSREYRRLFGVPPAREANVRKTEIQSER
jgi:AraC-like DNA-binding protein